MKIGQDFSNIRVKISITLNVPAGRTYGQTELYKLDIWFERSDIWVLRIVESASSTAANIPSLALTFP